MADGIVPQSKRVSDLPLVDRSKMRISRPNLSELISVESGGSNYQFKMEPRCKVCKKGEQVVLLVNNLLATGATYADVLRQIEPVNMQYPEKERISYNSIVTHQKKHMPYEAYAVRQIIEARAEKAGKDFIEGSERLIDAAGYAQAMMEKGFQTLADPNYKVDPEAGLAAAKFYHNILQDESGSLDAAQALANLSKIIDAVKVVCSDDQIDRILAIIDGQAIEGDVVEVDIVDTFDDEDDYDPQEDDEEDSDDGF